MTYVSMLLTAMVVGTVAVSIALFIVALKYTRQSRQNRPERIAIDHDDYHAKHVGHLSDGRQFFLTTPFEPAIADKQGCEYIALFIFDAKGNLLDAQIDSLGPRDSIDENTTQSCFDQKLHSLGHIKFNRIVVKPFAVERFDTVFGLIVCEPDDRDGEWSVEMQPGNYMAFYEPWNSGKYDT